MIESYRLTLISQSAVFRGAVVAALLGFASVGNSAWAQEPTADEAAKPAVKEDPVAKRKQELFQKIKWVEGPATADLETAEVKIPEGFRFTGKEGSAIFQEITENPPSSSMVGIMTPVESIDFFVTFEYNDTGYINDSEKDKIDANAILASIRKGTEQSNEFRKSRGWAQMGNLNWVESPSYDATTHNLVWAISADSGGETVVNYNTRILGRRGVIVATMVTDPNLYRAQIPTVKGLLSGLEYKAGLRYAEFQTGDKVAAYGLTALITGGAAAVALKTGLFAKLGLIIAKFAKVIIGGVIAISALIFKSRAKTS